MFFVTRLLWSERCVTAPLWSATTIVSRSSSHLFEIHWNIGTCRRSSSGWIVKFVTPLCVSYEVSRVLNGGTPGFRRVYHPSCNLISVYLFNSCVLLKAVCGFMELGGHRFKRRTGFCGLVFAHAVYSFSIFRCSGWIRIRLCVVFITF